LVKSSTEHA
jgi:hypothetical protein